VKDKYTRPNFSDKLLDNVVLPVLDLPITNTPVVAFTSCGIGLFDSRIVEFLITNYLY
jgi:hypothetical protein